MEESEVKNAIEEGKEKLESIMTAAVEEAADKAEEAAEKAEEAVDEAKALGLSLKQKFTGKVAKLGLSGARIDLGNGQPAFLHISQFVRPEGKENCNNAAELLNVGDEINVWVKRVKDGMVELTMVEPLALEWREIKKDMTVKGTVAKIEKYGAFVEIGAERQGLVHISEMAHTYVREPGDILKVGDEIEAMVLEVNKRKKQIKLSIKALQPEPEETEETAESEKTPAPRTTSARAQQLKEGKFNTEPREKRQPKRNNKKREGLNEDVSNFLFTDESAEGEEMTAMEIAWRSAQEKAKSRTKDDKKKKGVAAEQEDILSRTLNNKVG